MLFGKSAYPATFGIACRCFRLLLELASRLSALLCKPWTWSQLFRFWRPFLKTLSPPHPAKMSLWSQTILLKIFILTTTATMTWRVKAAPARVTFSTNNYLDLLPIGQTVAICNKSNSCTGVAPSGKWIPGSFSGSGMQECYQSQQCQYCPKCCKYRLVDICNTWDNTDTAYCNSLPDRQ